MEINIPRQTIKNLSGIIICLLQSSFLSVGAFCERPRANAVRPYRVWGNFSDKDNTRSVRAFFICAFSYYSSGDMRLQTR